MSKIHLFISVFLLFACQKDDLSQEVVFYSIKKFDKDGAFAIDEASVELGNEILISYDNLLSYDAKGHTFSIPTELAREIDVDKNSSGYFQKPFAVAIGKKIIYTGYFWSAISSLAPDWTTATPFGNKLKINLGFGHGSVDHRNDPQILDIFRRDGKLVE